MQGQPVFDGYSVSLKNAVAISLATGGSPAFHEGGGPCAFIARRFLRDLITQLGRVVVAVVVGRMVLHNLPQCFGGLPASI